MTEEITMSPIDEEEGFFDDYTEDESETPTEEEPVAETEVKAEVEAKPFLQIKYNKENYDLTEDEARELAQKGKNYDNIYGRYASLNDRLSRLAEKSNMSVDDFLSQLDKTQETYEINKEVKALQKQYPNTDEDVLRELAQSRINGRIQQKEAEAQKAVDTQKDDIAKQVDAFNKRFPDLEADKLDDKVYDYMQEGSTLLEAYLLWKSEQTQSEAKVNSLNEGNRKRSMGNLTNSGAVDEDSFLKGFLDN